jgi:hypothetical protein
VEWLPDRKTEERLTREVFTILSKRGMAGDPDISDAEIQKTVMENHEFVFQNTLLLLKCYHKLKWSIASKLAHHADIKAENIFFDKNTNALIKKFFDTCEDHSSHLRSVFESTNNSNILIEMVDAAVENLKTASQNYYDIIYKTYVDEKYWKLSHRDQTIANELGISRTTYYNQRNDAISLMSFQLWGGDEPALLTLIEVAVVIRNYKKNKK